MAIAESKEDGRIISIAFDKLFNQKEISYMNDFSLAKKRNFVTAHELILNDLNLVLEKSNVIAMSYLQIKYNIVSKESYPKDDFISDLFREIITDELKEIIDEHVESTYTINLDEETKKSKNANEELQFTDFHAKIILKLSMCMKIIIPLITDYLAYHMIEVEKTENIFLEIFYKVFTEFEVEGVDILNKIFKLIDSRVVATRYSDAPQWKYSKNMAIDSNIASRQFYRKIIANIIPKIINNTNIISYLHVVIRNLIKFKFTENYLISYKPINLALTDSEGLSEYDKLEINMIRIDEGISIINKLTISMEIKRVAAKFNISITKNEFEYYKEKLVINKIQRNLVFLFFSKYIGSYKNCYNADYNEYVTLCIIMKKWLNNNNFPVLSKYIMSVSEKFSERRSINKKQFLIKLLESKKYKFLLNEKYKFVMQNIINSNIIVSTIATLKTNKFYSFPDYEEFMNIGIDDKIMLDEKIETISDEYLRLVEQI